MTMTMIIEATALSKRYGSLLALDRVSFQRAVRAASSV